MEFQHLEQSKLKIHMFRRYQSKLIIFKRKMSKITEVRLTLAAFIYGIENDLKNLIKKNITPYFSDLAFFHNSELTETVLKRFKNDNPATSVSENLDLVVEFLDFQDTFTILNKNNLFLSKEGASYLSSIIPILQEITPIRNRVMHTRPLLGGDFALVYDFIASLKKTDPFPWTTSLETRDNISKDPLYVLTLTIPSLREEESEVIHNLPIPDFDETGFIGRKKDTDDIKKLILSNKVVSIIGDGGIGKTALALKVAYDIIDMGVKCPFDLIIWTSAKTTMLTAKGIEDIHNTIQDYTGLLNYIEDSLKSDRKHSQDSKLEGILEYLEIYKTLLIIDNLETIQNEDVRLFIREAQMKCNIVITSRIGLGELEFPRKLIGLSEAESANLIREVARIRNSDTLLKLPQATLIEIASKLYFNPLALKWFVNTVQTGISPLEVLSNKDDLLNFCLTNVYEKLSDGAINVLNTIRGARKNLNTAEIIFLSQMQPIDVRKFINELFTTTLISRELTGQKTLEEITYRITDFAKDFLSKNHPLSLEAVKKVSSRLKSLSESVARLEQVNEHNEFGLNAISFRTPNEKIAARFLTEALSFSKKGDYINAFIKVNEAIGIVPNYFENYRISAFIKATSGDVLGAEDDYITGLEIEPSNVRLLYYYAQFLLFQIEDYDKAHEYILKVCELRPNHTYSKLLLSRYYTVNQNYGSAIDITETLVNTVLNPKDRIVVYTDLISLYGRKAYSKMRVEDDQHGAIEAYQRGFDAFEMCVDLNILDFKMIKAFSDILLQFISVISPVHVSENKDRTKYLINKYSSQLALTPNISRITMKYNEKFDANFFDESCIKDESTKSVGKIQRNMDSLDRPFVFIVSDSARYYANKIDFVDIGSWVEWKKIRNGQLVSFNVGENHEGTCAKNIKLIEINR